MGVDTRTYNVLAHAAGEHKRRTASAEVTKIFGQIKRETDRAILVEVHMSKTEKKDIWFPLSQVKEIHREFSVMNDKLDSLVITQWIAKQKEIA